MKLFTVVTILAVALFIGTHMLSLTDGIGQKMQSRHNHALTIGQ